MAYSAGDVIDALWHAHINVIGGPCPVAWLEVESAHVAFETARYQAIHGNNPGNMRGHGNAGQVTIHGANEIAPDGHVLDGPEVESGFAAYRTLRDGCDALVRYLGTATKPGVPNRYQGAWDAACKGDVATFCRELRAHGYFTANLELYTKGVQRDLEWLRTGPMPDFLAHLSPSPTAA